jgi:NAD(P)H-flavin reductase
MGVDFDVTGRLSRSVFDQLGIPREADVYLCGPPRFMADMKEMLAAFGVAPGRIHVELFNGSESMTPGVVGAAPRAPHLPCRTGVCHNCESGLVWGAVAYEPQPLEKPADGNLLVCCSQPIGDVVIDL